ncbi:MAG: superoxide dismutase [Armatimonadetes bacterium]|nr:superoxide dismutase [Armatimonadota bacterium]
MKFDVKKFKSFEMNLDGISKKALEEHYKLYSGYVNKANEIFDKLAGLDKDPAKANPTFSDIRVLKVELTRALGGIKNHEIYFEQLGGGGDPAGKLADMINANFGSLDDWKKDLKATGVAARGWAWLAYDWDTKTLFNYIGDEQNTYPVWNCTPLIAMDVFEHAYFMDWGTNKGGYIDAFIKQINWQAVQARADAYGILR